MVEVIRGQACPMALTKYVLYTMIGNDLEPKHFCAKILHTKRVQLFHYVYISILVSVGV